MRFLSTTFWPAHLLNSYSTDPRHGQIMCLAGILMYGLWSGILVSQGTTLAAIWVGAMGTEYGLFKLRRPSTLVTWGVFKSSVITCLSLCLLLRVTDPAFALMAGCIAIGSKSLLRTPQGHWFNPANFALVVCTLSLDGAWISPGQWGQTLWLVVLVGAAGVMVSNTAARLDTALWFLFSYTVIIFSRAYWLGDPWSIPLQQIQSSALLIFAFFMLTDPKTSPRHTLARALYGFAIALLGTFMQFQQFQSAGIFYSLLISCACVPLLNHLMSAPVYQWSIKEKKS